VGFLPIKWRCQPTGTIFVWHRIAAQKPMAAVIAGEVCKKLGLCLFCGHLKKAASFFTPRWPPIINIFPIDLIFF
jgi:hypothetical protein